MSHSLLCILPSLCLSIFVYNRGRKRNFHEKSWENWATHARYPRVNCIQIFMKPPLPRLKRAKPGFRAFERFSEQKIHILLLLYGLFSHGSLKMSLHSCLSSFEGGTNFIIAGGRQIPRYIWTNFVP